jgi:hypothetical protein
MSHDASHDLCVPQTNLHKMKPKLANVWRDVTDKAEEAVKIFREQKRVARAIMNSQEEAFWRLHRPAVSWVDTPLAVCVCMPVVSMYSC